MTSLHHLSQEISAGQGQAVYCTVVMTTQSSLCQQYLWSALQARAFCPVENVYGWRSLLKKMRVSSPRHVSSIYLLTHRWVT